MKIELTEADLGTLRDVVTSTLTEDQRTLIGHMANNPLCAVISNLGWLLEEVDKDNRLDSDQLDALQEIMKSALRVQEVIGNLTIKVDPR